MMPRSPANANSTPAAPPAIANTRLSASNWRTSRKRLAPIDARMAISRRRKTARESSRFETLTHAITSRSPTAPNRIHSAS